MWTKHIYYDQNDSQDNQSVLIILAANNQIMLLHSATYPLFFDYDYVLVGFVNASRQQLPVGREYD